MTEHKNENSLKNNQFVRIIEILFLSAAAVFFSVISSTVFIDLIGLLCLITASALFACVLFLFTPGAIIVAGGASFVITYMMCGNMMSAAASLIYIVIGAFIYFGLKSKKKRPSITVGIACALAAIYIVMIVSSIVISTGKFSIRNIISAIDADLSNRVDSYIDQYYSVLPQYSAVLMDEGQAAYLDDIKKELAMNIKVIIPAIFVMYNALIAYLSTAMFRAAYNLFIPMANPGRKKIKNKYWRINISVISAIILLITMFLSAVLFNRDNLLPSIVLTNLTFILAPCFCIVGIYFAHDKIFKSSSGAGFFPFILLFGLVMFIFFLPFIAFTAIYFSIAIFMILGLYATLIGDIKKFYDKTKKLLLGGGDDGDDDNDDDDYID